MADLASSSALTEIARPGSYGAKALEPGVRVAERIGLGVATLTVRKGQQSALNEAAQAAYSIALPMGPRVAKGKELDFIGIGPGQWLAFSKGFRHEALAEMLTETFQGLASVADQSSARAVLRLEGPSVRPCLAKGLALDLNQRVFGETAAATSTIGHVSVVIWRDGAAFELAFFRSSTGSFWSWLQSSAAEFGLEVLTGS